MQLSLNFNPVRLLFVNVTRFTLLHHLLKLHIVRFLKTRLVGGFNTVLGLIKNSKRLGLVRKYQFQIITNGFSTRILVKVNYLNTRLIVRTHFCSRR